MGAHFTRAGPELEQQISRLQGDLGGENGGHLLRGRRRKTGALVERARLAVEGEFAAQEDQFQAAVLPDSKPSVKISVTLIGARQDGLAAARDTT